MNAFHRRPLHPATAIAAAVVLIVGPLALYGVLARLRVPSVSAAVISGMVLSIAIKHVGLLAVLLVPLAAKMRRRWRR